MRIEDISKSSLSETDANQLHSLRHRIAELWQKHFTGEKLIEFALSRTELLEAYGKIVVEIQKRGLSRQKVFAIDNVLFRKALDGVDVPSLEPILVCQNYVSIAGPFVQSGTKVGDALILVKDDSVPPDRGT